MSETISETVNIVASVLYVVSKVHCGVEICRVCLPGETLLGIWRLSGIIVAL